MDYTDWLVKLPLAESISAYVQSIVDKSQKVDNEGNPQELSSIERAVLLTCVSKVV